VTDGEKKGVLEVSGMERRIVNYTIPLTIFHQATCASGAVDFIDDLTLTYL